MIPDIYKAIKRPLKVLVTTYALFFLVVSGYATLTQCNGRVLNLHRLFPRYDIGCWLLDDQDPTSYQRFLGSRGGEDV